MARGALGTRGTRGARGGTGQVPGQAQGARPAAEAPVLILPPRAGSFRVWPPGSPRPASQPAPVPAHLLRPVPPSAMPPQEVPPPRQNPEKERHKCLALFSSCSLAALSSSTALRPSPLVRTISNLAPWTFPYKQSCYRMPVPQLLSLQHLLQDQASPVCHEPHTNARTFLLLGPVAASSLSVACAQGNDSRSSESSPNC